MADNKSESRIKRLIARTSRSASFEAASGDSSSESLRELAGDILGVSADCSLNPLSFGKDMTELLREKCGLETESMVFLRDCLPPVLVETGGVPVKSIRGGAGHSPDCPALTGKTLISIKAEPGNLCNECVPKCKIGQSMIRIPVLMDERVSAVLTLVFNNSACLSDPLLVKTIDRVLSLEFQSLLQCRMNRLLEITDHLTRAYNHRYFMKALENELERSRRYDHEFTLILTDLDSFRDFNNRHGHEAGDAMLHEVAVKLRSCIRTTDLLARFSGQQFAIILTETGPTGVDVVKRKLRTSVSKIALSRPGRDELLSTTISVGHAVFPVDAGMPSRLIVCAEDSLAKAKLNRKKA